MTKPCPLCGKPSAESTRPFCSQLCKDKDLLNWLNESYKIPVPASEEEDELPILIQDEPNTQLH